MSSPYELLYYTKKELVQNFFSVYILVMLEKEIEKHFDWAVQRLGGKTWKFTSPGRKGVADRIACLPDGTTWFVELKTTTGRLSELQKVFADEMRRLNQNYACLWTKEQVDAFVETLSK